MSTDEAPPPLTRCPNCDRLLQYPAGQAEAYCPSCHIFVDILRPMSPTASTEPPPESNAERLRTARLYLELDEAFGDEPEEEPAQTSDADRPEPAAAEAEPETEPAAPTEKAAPAEHELPTDEELDALLEYPAPAESAEELAAEPVEEPVEEPETPAERQSTPTAEPVTSPEPPTHEGPVPRRWHRVLFYAGSILIAVGGSGLALGSFLHDLFRDPFFGYQYDVFGPFNLSTLALGSLIVVAGVVAMVAGARAGARPRPAAGA